MSVQDLFKALKEEAGPDGAVILLMASPKQDMQILFEGSPALISWLLSFGGGSIQDECATKASSLITGEWKRLSDLRHLDLDGSPWDVIPRSR